MNTLDYIVIGIGFVVGWFAVSALIDWLTRRLRTRTLDSAQATDIDTVWPTVLGIASTASAEEIESAYQQRVSELQSYTPGIQTQTEVAVLEKHMAILDTARQAALARVRED